LTSSTLSAIIKLWKTYETKREGGKVKRNQLIRARKSKMLTQSEVAEKVELTVSGYRKIEYGERNPTLKTVKLLIEVLDIEIEML